MKSLKITRKELKNCLKPEGRILQIFIFSAFVTLLFSVNPSAIAATNEQVLAFLEPIEGQYTMTGKGCGDVTIEATEQGLNINVRTKGELFDLSFADAYKISKNALKYSYEETDNAWPNLSDWVKEEIVIQKDQAGRLASVSYKRRKGKPFYTNKVSTYFCQIL